MLSDMKRLHVLTGIASAGGSRIVTNQDNSSGTCGEFSFGLNAGGSYIECRGERISPDRAKELIADLFSAICQVEFMEWRHDHRMGSDLATLHAENERLRGIVDKLPKCWRLNEAGELVQDVPITPDMVTWQFDPQGFGNKGRPWKAGYGWDFQTVPGMPKYLTPEAAEAAIAATTPNTGASK